MTPRPGELVDEGKAGRGRRREDHQVGLRKGGLRRGSGNVHDVVLQRACDGPFPDGDQAAILQSAVLRVGPDRSRDRACDQTEPDEPELHQPCPLRRGTRRCLRGPAAAGRPSLGQSSFGGRHWLSRGLGLLCCRRGSLRALGRSPVTPTLGLLFGFGGPGSSAGLIRRCRTRRSASRRSLLRKAPHRGQRRSSANSASSGATV